MPATSTPITSKLKLFLFEQWNMFINVKRQIMFFQEKSILKINFTYIECLHLPCLKKSSSIPIPKCQQLFVFLNSIFISIISQKCQNLFVFFNSIFIIIISPKNQSMFVMGEIWKACDKKSVDRISKSF